MLNLREDLDLYNKHWDKTYADGSADKIEQMESINRMGNVWGQMGAVESGTDPATGKNKYVLSAMLAQAQSLNGVYARLGVNQSGIEAINALAAALRSGEVIV